jgi:Helix-turn-helix domain
MARPIKRQYAEPNVANDLRRRSRSITIGARDIAERLKTTPKRVSLWSVRFETSGLAALDDKRGRGREPSISNAKVGASSPEATRPPQGKTRWSIRSMSRHAGVSPSTVQRSWSKNDLKPHRLKTF